MNLTTASAFDAAAAAITIVLYLIVGAGVARRSPRDVRARTFAIVALASLAPYIMTILVWRNRQDAVLSTPFMAFLCGSLALGSVALFHFMQVFPAQRPWIARHPGWLIAAYVMLPAIGAALAAALTAVAVGAGATAMTGVGPGAAGMGGIEMGAVSLPEALIIVLLLIPTIAVTLVLLPCAALVSLYKSWTAASAAGQRAAAWTSGWILVSQLAGGALSIVIIPLLSAVVPGSPLVPVASALLFGFGLFMPIVYGWGVWRLGVLDVS